MSRCMFLVLMVAGLLTANSVQLSSQGTPPQSVRVITAEATIRVTADPNAVAMLKAPAGLILDLRAREGDWFSVWLPSDTGGRRLGYVAASEVEQFNDAVPASPAPAPAPAPPPAPAAAPAPAPVSKSPPSGSAVRRPKGVLDDLQLFVERLPPASRVVVQTFSATDADITNGEKKEETKTMQADGPRLLADRFVTRLKELGPFSDVSVTSDGRLSEDALIVGGKFVELDPGSRAKRYLVGFGSGKSAVAIEGSVTLRDGTVLATFRQRRVGVMGLGGGDSLGKLVSDAKSIGEDIAKFVSDWAKGSLK